MEFTYKKHDNEKLFSSLENSDLGLRHVQNYVPLYSLFFDLNETNWNSINLNNEFYLSSIHKKETDNIVNAIIKDVKEKQKVTKKVFFKYSPLLDPLKYLIGKYNTEDTTLLNLPSFINQSQLNEKVNLIHNSAYVDSFFSFLTSKLLNEHNFIHGVGFYGSFLAIKEQYAVNVYDDIEYINEFDFFHKNKNVLFTIDEKYNDIVDNDTRNYKKKLKLSNLEEPLDIDSLLIIDMNVDNVQSNCEPDIIYENVVTNYTKKTSSSSSSCSSRSSNSSNEDIKDDKDNDNVSEDGSNDGSNDDGSNDDDYSMSNDSMGEEVIININEFPVQIIALECCDDTLDSLMNDDEPIKDEEWDSIVLQILMTLITYQKTFGFTHNDLHTNNIMYTLTDKPFIYYKVEGSYYKVPTFGKLFKIIDFGRAIYSFKGQLLCSDSFHHKGDAATQYNFKPFFNPQKELVEPNYSFDLCRLGCSIYDYIVDDISEEHLIKSPIMKIMLDWCKDDKNRNIMYKQNGEERYPDFKLYKMISRKVHKHVPLNVLRNEYFDKYKITKKKIKDKPINNIDDLPSYMV